MNGEQSVSEFVVPDGTLLVVGDDSYRLDAETPIARVQEYDVVFSERAVKPDLSWRGDHGDHDHQWAIDLLPEHNVAALRGKRHVVTGATRTVRHVPCDGSCGGVCEGEGYHVQVWVCDATGDDLDPGTIPDPGPHRFLSGEYLSLAVESAAAPPERIDGEARIVYDGHTLVLGQVRLNRADVTLTNDRPPCYTYTGSPLGAVTP